MRLTSAVLLTCALAMGCNNNGSSTSSSSSSGSGSLGGIGGTNAGNTGGSNGSAGTNGSGGTSGTNPGTVAGFCSNVEASECAFFKNCGFSDPAAGCAWLEGNSCASLTGAGYHFDSQAASACASALQAGVANLSMCQQGPLGLFSLLIQPDGGGPCLSALAPGAAEGEACQGNDQCIPRPDGGAVPCALAAGTCAGTCSVVGSAAGSPCETDADCGQGYCDQVCMPYLGLGGDCSGEGRCALGTYCSDNGTTTQCSAYAQAGEPCGAVQCADPLICGFPPDGGFATEFCLTPPAPGAPCPAGGCPVGTYCGSADAGFENYCLPPQSLGSPCSVGSEDCPTGAFCDLPNDGGYSGTCRSQGALGASCPNSELDFSPCQGSLVCVLGHCQAENAANGDPCGFSGPGLGCENGTCNNPDGGVGVCIGNSNLGQPCTAAGFPRCTAPLQCTQGTCAAAPAVGQPCLQGAVCAFGDYCAGTVCAALSALGAACSAGAGPVCVSGYCDATEHCVPYLAAGAPCDPYLFQCSSDQEDYPAPDGGFVAIDPSCLASGNGAPTCALICSRSVDI